MWTFRRSCQQAQIELRQQISIKRLNVLSPNIQENKKQPKKSKEDLSGCSSRKQLHFQNLNKNSVYNKDIDTIITTPFTSIEQDKIQCALNSKQPLALINVISTCHTAELAWKKSICSQISDSCKALCKRKGTTSVLLSTSYQDLSEFRTEKVWQELLQNHPFLVDVFNAIAGNNCHSNETPEQLKLKYCLMYSILMQNRWHELSLLQRVNTVLLIEGGCSKQVCNIIQIQPRSQGVLPSQYQKYRCLTFTIAKIIDIKKARIAWEQG